jgi:3-deoxy-manno-octulosonate cytidylyltransferase (CMP-KDO synthetase)
MSRAPIPSNKSDIFCKSFKQICVYAFTKKALKIFFNKKNKTFFESIEDIEILRFLELGVKIRMMEGKGSQLAIDTLFDFKAAKKILEQ